MLSPAEQFGQIDIYLFDQILRGRITPGMHILDAGGGEGRNLVYLLHISGTQNLAIFGTDTDPRAVTTIRRLAALRAPHLPPENFRGEPVETMSFPDRSMDFIISSAVLHFASDDVHFRAMLHGMWRALKPGGLFFARIASSTGIEHQITPLAGRRSLLPDGSERYLVDDDLLIQLTEELGATLADDLKTTVVHNQRAMTTWVMRKKITRKNS